LERAASEETPAARRGRNATDRPEVRGYFERAGLLKEFDEIVRNS
jgi:hypothetical protein